MTTRRDELRVQVPGEVTLQTCIGCGARDRAGACTGDCVEVRLELVDAADARQRAEELERLLAYARAAGVALAALVERVEPLGETTGGERWPAVRAAAAEVVRTAPALVGSGAPWEPAVVATTWWCASCDRIEAPQPCIGVCVRRPQAMVAAAPAQALDRRAARVLAAGRERHALLRLVASVRPRSGQVAETWRALAGRAAALDLDAPL